MSFIVYKLDVSRAAINAKILHVSRAINNTCMLNISRTTMKFIVSRAVSIINII